MESLDEAVHETKTISNVSSDTAPTSRKKAGIPNDIKAAILDRCKMDMQDYGSTLTKACVDQDIKAYKSLQTYSSEYSQLIERCRRDMLGHGWMLVKACVDQDVKAQKALDRY